MRRVEFRLEDDRLTNSAAPHARRLTDADFALFADWTGEYRKIAWRTDGEAELLALGRRILSWLDADGGWISALRNTQGTPVVAEFATGATPGARGRSFLGVPWELAAEGDTYLAAVPALMWAPLRRIGERLTPEPPDHTHRLGVMFMAAAPRGQTSLSFEAEEAAILRDTAQAGIDLFVEDTGTLDELAAAWDRAATLDALHLSCHGAGGTEPFLVLEDEVGDAKRASLDDLAVAFVPRHPRLLFLSACHTGEGADDVNSLALGLVQAGFGAVLGWADAVFDSDASAFAAEFYREAGRSHMTVEEAWAAARFRLLHRPGRPPLHWHLARLFLGAAGGGTLSKGGAPRVATAIDAGRKAMIRARGAAGDRLEVAGRYDFVGRRRQIQDVLRAFRRSEHAGVLVYGFGRQGKSSLAARIMDRRPDLKPVVLFQRCDGPNLLAEIAEQVPQAGPLCDEWQARVDPAQRVAYDPQALYRSLRALLTGPCQHGSNGNPILLVLDDFEALLDPPDGAGHWQVKPESEAPLAAIIRAFDAGGTNSRLLITCRYGFAFRDRSQDLAARLLLVSLPSMPHSDARKQAEQKRRAAEPGAARRADRYDVLADRAIAAARGNTGLRALLFQAALAGGEAGEAAIRAVEGHFAGGAPPEDDALRATLETLAIAQLTAPLSAGEHSLLRAARLFRLPLPLPVWRRLANAAGLGPPDRLLAFGLWERVPDIVDPRTPAAAINAIAAAWLGEEKESLSEQIAAPVLGELLQAWGGTDRLNTLFATDIELTRLALLCEDLDVLAATAFYAVIGHERMFAYRESAATAKSALDALAAGGRGASPALLRAAAEAFERTGDPDGLHRVYDLAPDLARDDPAVPSEERIDRAHFRGRFGGYLIRQGEPDQALAELRAAVAVFDALGDRRSRAVTLGDIARIVADKGDVDEALKIHHEQVQIFEALGDRRSRAVTLGDIARIVADKGDVDEALKIHHEQVQIFEALGDRRSRAVTLGDIARIMRGKGDVDEALKIHHEEMQTYEALGDRRSRAVTLGDIARIVADKGDVDEALKIHHEQVQIFEALGDRRSRAVTLGDIARIVADKGDVDEALKIHHEQVQIFEALGDRRSRAVTLGDIARIMRGKGDVDEALKIHHEEMQTYEALGDRRSRAVTLGDIARIVADKGDVDEALKIHHEQVQIFEALGDRRSRAVTLGDIARIVADKGDVDEALKIHHEQVQIFEALGDRRSRAVTLGDIARIMRGKGDVDEALKIHHEQVQIFEALGDRRSRAVTLGDIARIMRGKGDVDEALKIHHERLQTYEALGDRRSRAVTLGDIARIMRGKGDVDEALTLQRERLAVNRALGDQDGVAAANFDIGEARLRHAVEHQDAAAFKEAVAALAESYTILLKTGRLDGICFVGATLGQALAMAGQRDDAQTVLQRSLEGFRRLGRPREAEQIGVLLRQLG